MKSMWSFFRSACAFLLASSLAWAQGSTSVSGVVKDPSGAAVQGATVTLVSKDNTASMKTISDQSGHYRFGHLSPTSYLISATAKGMESSAVQTIDLTSGAQADAELQLRLSAVTSSVTVTASGTAQTTDETAKSISIVGLESIQSLDTNTIADALSYVPGLRLEQQGGPGGLVSIKTRGLPNQDTAVLIDGFRFRDVTGTQGDASPLLQDLLVSDIDHIEVLRGTGSSIYGTDATGGVVNIVTGAGGGKTRGSVLLEGGSLGTFRGQAAASGSTLHNRLGYSVGAAYLDVTGGLDGNLPDRTTNAQGMFDYAISNKTRVFGRMYFTDSSGRVTQSPSAIASGGGVVPAIPLTGEGFKRYQNGVPLSEIDTGNATYIPDIDDPDYTRAARSYVGALAVSSHPTNTLSLTADYQGLASNRNFTNGPLGQGYQPYGGTEILNYDGLTNTASGRFNWQLGKYQVIDGGYEFESEYSYNGDTEPDPSASFSTAVTEFNQAFFVQDQLHLLDGRLQIAGSYRYQFFNLETPTFVPSTGNPYSGSPLSSPPAANTGDASVAYIFRQPGTKIRAHAGSGYRAPSLYERFGAGFYGGYTAYGDPELKPERSRAIDGGFDQTFWNRRAEASATYFYTRLNEVIIFDNFLDPTTDPLGRYYGYANSKGGIARGVESSFAISPISKLNIRAAYTFTDAHEQQPQSPGIYQTFIIPDHQFSLLATGHPTPNLTVVFGTVLFSNYLAPIFNATTFASQVFRFDGLRRGQVGASYRHPFGESLALRAFVNVNNAFNQSYYESGYRTPDATAMSGLQFEF
jgi:iron complex outermembrane receptor protein